MAHSLSSKQFEQEKLETGEDCLVNGMDFIEEPWTLIESYFKNKHLEQLVRHQLESYNEFVDIQLVKTIEMFNPVHIVSDQDYIEEFQKYRLEIDMNFRNMSMYRPEIHENNGATKLMFPNDARLRNFTYACNMNVDLEIEYTIRSGEFLEKVNKIKKILPKIHLGKFPIMLKSSLCVLNQYKHMNSHMTNECHMDPGGYFIINGQEKTCLGQEKAADNKVYCYKNKKDDKYICTAEIRCVPDWKVISPKQTYMMVSSKVNASGHEVLIQIPRIKKEIPIFVLFRALGVISDKDICEKIVLNIDDEESQSILAFMSGSICQANDIMLQEDAIRYITNFVAYTPMNMDKVTGSIRKREFALEVLENDLFPHCKTHDEKVYLLGYMVNKICKCCLNIIPEDDRDSYVNKRIETTGVLLNNLVRNYLNRVVRDATKQTIREINNGSWKSNENYGNIINMTNIYKIIKSSILENGLKRALATGDFGIKMMNTTKVGVAQVLNRLTYASSISHLRRINNPIDKGGKLVPPRKLHGSSWGFLCPSETPEGQAIGIVKNISYMTCISGYSNSDICEKYIEPYLISFDVKPIELFSKVKVFLNSRWMGVTTRPIELFEDLKNKKITGMLNSHISICFDYKTKEIHVYTDAGRLIRPLFRVKNNKLVLQKQIIDGLLQNKISWIDLFLNLKIEEAVLEYIDCEQQSHEMICMNPKQLNKSNFKYTLCEIHPSTMYGVLASCIPFPEHNQSPRNTYQCAMGKQAIGVYVSNFQKRMDKTAYMLNYGMRPLVDTRLMGMLNLHNMPSGNQVIVAIMTHTGFNQEDSILVNEGSIKRGLFQATIYHTEKDEDKKVNGDEEVRTKPDMSKTKNIKFGNYDKLNKSGVMRENTLIEDKDIIISKVVVIKQNKNDNTKVIKYEDQSKMYRTHEKCYVDKNYINRNGDGYKFCKVRIRATRQPVIGDKMCIKENSFIMTTDGWIKFKDIDIKRHKVATLRDGKYLDFVYPTNKYEYDCVDEPLYTCKNKDIEMTCTQNHKVYVKQIGERDMTYEPSNASFELIEACSIKNTPVKYKKNASNINVDNGYVQFIHFNFSTEEFANIISDIIYHKYHINAITNEYSIHSKNDRYKMLYNFIVPTSNREPKLPRMVWSLSSTQCQCILHRIMELTNNNFTTSCKSILNDIQRLALHSNWSCTLYKYVNTHDRNQSSVVFTAVVEKEYNEPKVLPHEVTIDTYNGKVGCIEVPNTHIFMYKETFTSPPCWTGNSSRHGQKGTIGNIIPECDMPFTKDGIKPDIIINPHAIPSRMTIAQLKETILGKIVLQLGLFGDGTSFGEFPIKRLVSKLSEFGYESKGNEVLYNGVTGKQIETSIFIGPVFYQRLKHMVNDKQHSRAIGPMVNLTRQPAEGRSRDGGLRVGEMERDVIIAHGASKFVKDRLLDASDKYTVHVCKKCGMIASYNEKEHIHLCKVCENRSHFAMVHIPYSCKLLFQELISMNVVPRMITEG